MMKEVSKHVCKISMTSKYRGDKYLLSFHRVNTAVLLVDTLTLSMEHLSCTYILFGSCHGTTRFRRILKTCKHFQCSFVEEISVEYISRFLKNRIKS